VIETQVARATPDLECLWGSDEGTHRGPGIVAVRSDPNHVEGDRSVVLVLESGHFYLGLTSPSPLMRAHRVRGTPLSGSPSPRR
jgi:hypothetical protein